MDSKRLATNAFQPVYFDPATRLLWGRLKGFMIQYGPGMTILFLCRHGFPATKSVNTWLGALRTRMATNVSIQPGINLAIPAAVGQIMSRTLTIGV